MRPEGGSAITIPSDRGPGSTTDTALPLRGDGAVPTTFGPTGVDSAALTARLANKLDVTTSRGETTTVRVRGELLQETAPTFTDTVALLGDDAAVSELVVDLSATTFMDSTGLGTLVSLRNKVLVRGGRFLLVRPEDRVFRLFEITRLDSVFEFVEA